MLTLSFFLFLNEKLLDFAASLTRRETHCVKGSGIDIFSNILRFNTEATVWYDRFFGSNGAAHGTNNTTEN